MSTRTYQRRRRGPVIAFVCVLAAAAAAVWTSVLLTTSAVAGGAPCPAPTAGRAGTVVGAPTVASVPPAAVKVTVVNGGGQRGQANLVAAQLGDLGFAQGAVPGNDPLFPDGGMACVAEVRFGPAGVAAASTVALVLPCAELVRDSRPGDGVDVSVGTSFGELTPTRAALAALDQLGATPATAGGDPNAAPAPGPAPSVDPKTLAAARVCA